MNVYHGSYTEVREIDLSAARPKRDFGKGFYVTTNRKQAEKWAEIQGRRNNCQGIVSVFEFSQSAFSDNYYKTIKFPEYTNDWFEFIIKNRSNELESNVHDYDIVEGPVADDDIYENVERYLAGKISKEDFFESLKFKHFESHQICFCTEKSLNTISRIKSPIIEIKDIAKKVVSRLIEYDGLSEAEEEVFFESEAYKKLSNENTLLYLKPWQDTYVMAKLEIEKNRQKEKGIDGLSL